MIEIDTLLAQLDKVRETSRNQWIACCPAHDDKNPSMGIKIRDDGSILLTCFSGCDRKDVLQSLGLKFKDVMPGSKLPNGEYARSGYYERAAEWDYKTGMCILFLSVAILEKSLDKVGLGIKLSESEKIDLFKSAKLVKNLYGRTRYSK